VGDLAGENEILVRIARIHARLVGDATELQLHAYTFLQIAQGDLPGPSAVVRMADSVPQLAPIRDAQNVKARLDLVFNDSGDDFGIVRSPSDGDAARILEFVRAQADTPHIVFQCQVGIGRSLAALAALMKIGGADPRPLLHRGTHNRVLYRKILEAAGLHPDPEPLVSLVVRVKYSPDRMTAFLLSIQRQRYDNWELVFVTDGPNAAAREVVARADDARVVVLETPTPRGRWGHPYRKLGIAAARGAFIGLSNDDNYYVPGYLEQMVNALARDRADLAMAPMLHSYWGWKQADAGHDVGSWIASRELMDRTPWEGDDFSYDAYYLDQLKKNAGDRITILDRPLFIHN